VRSGKTLDAAHPSITQIAGDLDNETALATLSDGADLILHLAGAIKAPNRNAFMHANRDGTQAMLTAWKQHAPDANFVLMSSLAARHPELSHYAASKAAAETAALDTGAIVYRPTAIYGPKDRETLRLFQATRWPVQISLNSAEAKLSFIHIDDVVDALIFAASHSHEMQGKTFELCDANLAGYAWSDAINAATACWGRKSRIVRLPAPILRLGGSIGDLKAYFGNAPMLTSQKCREILFPDWSVKSAHTISPDLWSPKIEIHGGFKQTFDWYRHAGWL